MAVRGLVCGRCGGGGVL